MTAEITSQADSAPDDGASSPDAQEIELSIVVPAYNEEERIGPTLREYVDHFQPMYADSFEVIVSLNGCTDATRDVVEQIGRSAPQVRIIEFVRPLGKGGAIWEGLAVARGQKVVFVDADNMVRAPEAAKLVRALDTHDAAIADRFSGHQDAGGQPPLRRLVSVASRLWVRLFLSLPYSDTQCGAKAFRIGAWRQLAPSVVERGWAFDLDVLVNARRLDFKVAEIPVQWQHIVRGSKVQAWKDVPQTFLATFRIRQRARKR